MIARRDSVLSIAAINDPDSVVLSGETHALSRQPGRIRETVESWLREVLRLPHADLPVPPQGAGA